MLVFFSFWRNLGDQVFELGKFDLCRFFDFATINKLAYFNQNISLFPLIQQ